MPESRAVIGRLQRQTLSLLPHLCISDWQQHQQRLRLAASAALAASDASTAACAVDVDDVVAQMSTHVYDVLSNVVRLCTTLVTTSGTRTCQLSAMLTSLSVILKPRLHDTTGC